MEAYTGEGESRKSGCNLWRGIPQKGHKGLEGISLTEDSVKDLKSKG